MSEEAYSQRLGDMQLINLTPHTLNLASPSGEVVELPPSGTVARVASSPGELRDIPGVPVPVAEPDRIGSVEGLPEPQSGTLFVVSALVGAAVRGRRDVLVPGTGPADGAIRENGRIVAVTRLKRP